MMEMFAGIRYTVVEKSNEDDTGIFVSLNDVVSVVAARVTVAAEESQAETDHERELSAAVAMGALAVAGILSDIEQDYLVSQANVFNDSTIQEFLEGGGNS